MPVRIRERERVVEQHYRRNFDYEGKVDWGFSFECDEKGVVDVAKLEPVAQQSYADCLTGFIDGRKVVDKGVKSFTTSYVSCALMQCCPGPNGVVHLSHFTNTCECCGADYNMSGQRIGPREQWGEETGEHWADVANIL